MLHASVHASNHSYAPKRSVPCLVSMEKIYKVGLRKCYREDVRSVGRPSHRPPLFNFHLYFMLQSLYIRCCKLRSDMSWCYMFHSKFTWMLQYFDVSCCNITNVSSESLMFLECYNLIWYCNISFTLVPTVRTRLGASSAVIYLTRTLDNERCTGLSWGPDFLFLFSFLLNIIIKMLYLL